MVAVAPDPGFYCILQSDSGPGEATGRGRGIYGVKSLLAGPGEDRGCSTNTLVIN